MIRPNPALSGGSEKMSIEQVFEKHHDQSLKFEKVEVKRSKRADLHAFLLLDELFPGDCDIVAEVIHDQIFLGVEENDFEKLTEKQVVELIRCGVFYDEDSLSMFV